MPDLDVKKSLQNGLNFKKVFAEIIIYSFSIFLALSWNGLFSEILTTYIPKGQNLMQKIELQVLLTFFIVGICWIIVKWESREKPL